MTQARRLHVTVVGDGRGIESALDACVVVPASEVTEDRTADCVILLAPTPPDIAAARRLASSGAPTAVLIDDAAASRNLDLAGLGFRDVRYATVASLPTILAQIAAANTSGPLRAIVRAADSGTQFEVVVASGSVRQDDLICEARDGLEARVESVVDLGEGSVRIQLDRAIRCDVGDLLCHPSERPEVADQFSARLTWDDGHPLIAGRSYRFVVGEKIVAGSVTTIKHRIEPDMAGPLAARTLQRGETGSVNISLRRPVAFDLSEGSGQLRRLRVLDAVNDLKLGTGTLDFALRRASNIHWQSVTVSKTQRAAIKQQKPVLVWFTGLSGSGKSTIANLLESRLLAEGCHTYLLDGDNVRHGLNRDLGFTDADRVENIRRVGEIAKLMVDAGLIVLASFISPFEAERALARELLGEGEFIEVFVDAPLAVAEERDPKGLYRRARRGELRNFTGIDSPYERPGNPEMRLDTATTPAEALAQQVFDFLAERGHLAS